MADFSESNPNITVLGKNEVPLQTTAIQDTFDGNVQPFIEAALSYFKK